MRFNVNIAMSSENNRVKVDQFLCVMIKRRHSEYIRIFYGVVKVVVMFPPSQEKLKKIISAPLCEMFYRRADLSLLLKINGLLSEFQ